MARAKTIGVEIVQCLGVSFLILLVILIIFLIKLLYKQGPRQNGAILTLSLGQQNEIKQWGGSEHLSSFILMRSGQNNYIEYVTHRISIAFLILKEIKSSSNV